jgi:hypothetical protein
LVTLTFYTRKLGEIDTVPHHQLLEVTEREQGDLAGIVTSRDDMLPDSACDILNAHIGALYDSEGFPQVGSLPKIGYNLAREEVRNYYAMLL